MRALLKKEINRFFSSLTGPLTIGLFLVLTSLLLWVIPGRYNVLDSGYARLDGLFDAAPWLYLFLLPAITMRLFSEEYRSGTMDLLLVRPVRRWSVVLAKYIAACLTALLSLVFTLVFLVSVCALGMPFANVDFGAFWGSFIGLLLLACSYAAVGLFFSSLTENAVVAFLLSALACLLLYAGFDAVSPLLPTAAAQECCSAFGMAAHYDALSRGVIDTRDVAYFLLLTCVFLWGTRLRLGWPGWRGTLVLAGCVLLVTSGLWIGRWRWDMSAEKRFSLSDNTRNLLQSLAQPVRVDVYLSGDLNRGFLQLQTALIDLLKEMNVYAVEGVEYHLINPAQASTEQERQQQYESLLKRGMQPTMVYDKDAEGNRLQKTIFPWAVCSVGGDTLAVNLLKNVPGLSGEENLNASIETLEFELTDALRRMVRREFGRVAFLEGHGEWPEPLVQDFETELARYYQVDRGTMNGDIDALDAYQVVIVAGPTERFSEQDKFLLDQYLMRGGRLLLLMDGVRTDKQQMGIANDLNLEDWLFSYGLRISPVLLLDTQCAMVPMNVAAAGSEPDFQPAPWYYAPLLLTAPDHVITRNIAPVKADFCSLVEPVGEPSAGLHRHILLASSNRTAIEKAPMPIRMNIVELSPESPVFANAYVPVAILEEGHLSSVFAQRMVPPGVRMKGRKSLKSTTSAKLIVVADGDIAYNEVSGYGEHRQVFPLGYDRYMERRFGNADFLLNAVNYLTDEEGWMQLRGRQWKLRLLDKARIREQRWLWQVWNVGLPLLLLIIFSVVYQLVIRYNYRRLPKKFSQA